MRHLSSKQVSDWILCERESEVSRMVPGRVVAGRSARRRVEHRGGMLVPMLLVLALCPFVRRRAFRIRW